MRTLNSNEILYVNGGNLKTFLASSFNTALSWGADGVLINLLVRQAVTAPIIGYGFACGAAVSFAYSIAREIVPNPFTY